MDGIPFCLVLAKRGDGALCGGLFQKNEMGNAVSSGRIFARFFGVKDFIIKFASAIRWIDASLAQLVEHDTLNVGVQGSSP